MDWFERLTGFQETDYEETRARLTVEGTRLRSLTSGKSYGIGELTQGHSKNAACHEGDGVGAILAEVLAGFGD